MVKKDGVPIGGSVGYISCDADRFSREFVEKSFEMFLGFINDFFNKEKKVDYFRKRVEEDKYKSGEITSKEIKKIMPANEPDMLAIRFENSIPAAIVLIEVKSTYEACANRKSGIIKHMEGMRKYIEEDIYRKSRKEDAAKCLLHILMD